MNRSLNDYFEALERLKKGNTINVPAGTKINKDTVALEAGRKRGTIKKSREVFSELIIEIDNAELEKSSPLKEYEKKLNKYKSESKKYRQLYEESLNRELMYIERINELEKIKIIKLKK